MTCNLEKLRKWLKKSDYFKDKQEETYWEYEHVVLRYCAEFNECEKCPWSYIKIMLPKKKFSFLS